MSSSAQKYALLVIDMQERFRSIGEGILAEINKTMNLCRDKQIPIVITQHGHRYPKFDSGVLGDFWKGDLSTVGDPDWKLMTDLKINTETDLFITEKRRYDAFYGTTLQDMLQRMEVNTVVISGVMTNLCCETTARSAFTRDFHVVFLSDGNATATPEMHNATLMNIEYGFGKVISCQQFRKLIADYK